MIESRGMVADTNRIDNHARIGNHAPAPERCIHLTIAMRFVARFHLIKGTRAIYAG